MAGRKARVARSGLDDLVGGIESRTAGPKAVRDCVTASYTLACDYGPRTGRNNRRPALGCATTSWT